MKYFCLLVIILSSCIKNDIPYPKEILYIKSIEFLGQKGEAIIDENNFLIKVSFPEEVDLTQTVLKKLTVSDGAKSSLNEGESIDLSSPKFIKLSKYQDYMWQIKADQPIDIIFDIKDQIGMSYIKGQKKVIAYLLPYADVSKVFVKNIKLDRVGIDISKADKERLIGKYVDFTKSQKVVLEKPSGNEIWTLSVLKAKGTIETLSADGLVRVAYLYAKGPENGDVGFEYKPENAKDWIKIDDSTVEKLGNGNFRCILRGLNPSSKYVCRSTFKNTKGNEISFSTIAEQPIPGGGDFDNFNQAYWDSSNSPGAGNVAFTDDVPKEVGKGKSVKMTSKSVFGVFASASVYLGKFVRKDGLTNAILSFGRSYTSMPTKFNGYYKFKTSPVNYVGDSKFNNIKGKPDSCFIYAMLIDRDPIEIRTNSSNRQLIDFNAKYVIAVAELTKGSNVDQWAKFSVPFVYRKTNVRPKNLIIVASSSKYGDYFTGGNATVLDVDNFSFSFD